MFFSGIFGGGHANATAMNHPVTSNANAPWTATTTPPRNGMMPMMHNGVFGLVQTVSGTTIIVDGHQGTTTATTTYTVDASNAKIIKGSATSTASISDIVVGDHVVVLGTVNSDDSIVATTIIDGRVGMMGMGGRGIGRFGGSASSTPPGRAYGAVNRMPPGMNGRYGTSQGQVNPGGPMQPAQGNPQGAPGTDNGQNGGQGQGQK